MLEVTAVWDKICVPIRYCGISNVWVGETHDCVLCWGRPDPALLKFRPVVSGCLNLARQRLGCKCAAPTSKASNFCLPSNMSDDELVLINEG